jgi:dTDP-4-dehydrorhamnose 3,5-epimerase
VLIAPQVISDDRGFFFESYRADAYRQLGIGVDFVQDNHSRSVLNTLRGLHFQRAPGQAKLVRCARGRIFDVAVDLRQESPTFGQYEAFELDDVVHHQLFIPIGFAHGFCVQSPEADVVYKVSSYYDPATESGIAWDDPDIGIAWPVRAPLLSERDRKNQTLADYAGQVGT